MGTLVELEPPAPLLRAALRERLGVLVDEREAVAAMRAEIAFYRARHLEGADHAGLEALRRSCAEEVRRQLPVLANAAPEAVLGALLAALRFRAYADAAPALVALRRVGVRLVAVSNWDVSLHDVLRSTGLTPLLDGVVSSAETGEDKPAAGPFVRALELAGGIAPGDAVHVGDRLDEDVAGARAAGIRPLLLVRDGEPPGDVEHVRSLAQLPERIGLST